MSEGWKRACGQITPGVEHAERIERFMREGEAENAGFDYSILLAFRL